MQAARDWLKNRITAATTELHALRKARLALRTHHDGERRRVYPVFAVETAAARRRQLVTRYANLQLRFDNLFCDITADLDHALVIGLAQLRDSQHMLSRRNRSQNHTARSSDTSIALVVNVNLRARWRHDHEPGIFSFDCF